MSRAGLTIVTTALAGVLLAGCSEDVSERGSEPPVPTSPAATPSAPPAAAGTPTAATTEQADRPRGETCGADGLAELAFIFVTDPVPGEALADGDEVAGCSNTFEAAYVYELLDADGAVLDEGFGTASCGTGCVGAFSFPVSFTVEETQVGTLRVFAESPRDGSETHLNAVPVLLRP